MAELLTETLLSPHYGIEVYAAGHKQKPKEVTTIMESIQCFGVFMAIVSLKEAHRIPDLISYQNLIAQTSINSQEGRWILYDRRFRLKASATATPEWSSIDITVWRMAFPDRLPAVINLSTRNPQPYKPSVQLFSGGTPLAPSPQVCLEWNEDPNPECSQPSGKFNHVCYWCVQTNILHKAIFCPYKQNGFIARPLPRRGHHKDFLITLDSGGLWNIKTSLLQY